MKRLYLIPIMIGLAALVSGCPSKKPGTPLWMLLLGGGGGDPTPGATYTVGGHVLGLGASETVSLQLNGAETISVASNTAFSFTTALSNDDAYRVLVSGVTTSGTTKCMASANRGTIASSNVTGIMVHCNSTLYTLSVNVTGLETGNTVVLQNNGQDDLPVLSSGTANFSTQVPATAGYHVEVTTQPGGFWATQSCNTSGTSSGTMTGDTTVTVLCGPTYQKVSGSFAGLDGNGLQVRLNNTGETLTFNKAGGASGTFDFPTNSTYHEIAAGTNYTVAILQNPSNLSQTCTFAGGATTATGTVGSTDITLPAITCDTSSFTVSGTITGMETGNSVILTNNGGSNLTINASPWNFSFNVVDGTTYSIAVATHAAGKTCSVPPAGSGTMAGASQTFNITCAYNTYTVGGSVSGLCSDQSVTLRNNGGNAITVYGSSPNFTFPAQNDLSSYAVSASTAPTGVTCSVSPGGSGSLAGANVTGVQVTCSGCMSCNGTGTLNVVWNASRSYDVNNAAGGGHKVYFQTTSGASKSSPGVWDVPRTTSTTGIAIPGRTSGCTYYVKVAGYSAINPTGGGLSGEMSATIP